MIVGVTWGQNETIRSDSGSKQCQFGGGKSCTSVHGSFQLLQLSDISDRERMVLQTMTSCSQNYSDLLFVTVPTPEVAIESPSVWVYQLIVLCLQHRNACQPQLEIKKGKVPVMWNWRLWVVKTFPWLSQFLNIKDFRTVLFHPLRKELTRSTTTLVTSQRLLRTLQETIECPGRDC